MQHHRKGNAAGSNSPKIHNLGDPKTELSPLERSSLLVSKHTFLYEILTIVVDLDD